MLEITLSEYALAKSSSLLEIVEYASSKGVTLKPEGDYTLSPSELKAIDPIFFFQRRNNVLHKKASTSNKSVVDDTESSNKLAPALPSKQLVTGSDDNANISSEVKGMKLVKAGKYFGKTWDEIGTYLSSVDLPIILGPVTRLSDAQYDALKSHFGKAKKLLSPFDDVLLQGEEAHVFIGGVQFYDSYRNHFGYLSSNALFSGNGNPRSLRFEKSDIIGETPSDDDLVFFKAGASGYASNVQLISSRSAVDWNVVLRYVGKYKEIVISRKNHLDTRISDVLLKVIQKTQGSGLLDAFVEIIDKLGWHSERAAQFLEQYLSGPTVVNWLRSAIVNSDLTYQGSVKLLTDYCFQRAIEDDRYEEAVKLKDKFDAIAIPDGLKKDFYCNFFVHYHDVNYLSSLIEACKFDCIAQCIKNVSVDEQYSLLCLLDEGLKSKILSEYFEGSPVHNLFVKEEWESVKSDLPYVVFDIESDGTNISQFTYKQEDNVREYSGEAQIRSLARALKKQPIIVGHNIRIWDLPILKSKGFDTDSFVWDTLEMEILLNPCRYAYSLHTEHNATADTLLTDKLFWNQLYRLASDDSLCQQLRDFLPSEIEGILETIRLPRYADFLKEEAHVKHSFFQEIIEPADSLKDELRRINEIHSTEKALIIAPVDLWARIAQYVHVAFPKSSDEIGWRVIDEGLVNRSTELSAIKKCILKRFIMFSKTPIIANLAQYLRVEKISNEVVQLSDSILLDFSANSKSNIHCIDVDAFGEESIKDNDYQHIFIIGSELQDRTHKCKLDRDFSFSELLALHSKLPFSMASSNYCRVDDVELKKLGIKKPSLTANVWAERNDDGSFALYHNFEYQVYRKNFLKHFSNCKPIAIDWVLSEKEFDKSNIVFYATDKRSNFDSSVYRLTPNTTLRAKYWTYQIAVLQKIHEEQVGLPIVYVVNSQKEIPLLTEFVQSLGFYVPQEGTSFRKLEYIKSHKDGLIIIDKEQFLNGIGNYRTDHSLCYVWDNMDVERYQLMWRKLPFEKDPVDSSEDEYNQGPGSSVKQCVLAEWPIFEHYYSLIAANNRESKFCVIEPSIEEYTDVADIVGCEQHNVAIWSSNSDYVLALDHAKNFFVDSSVSEKALNTMEAMVVIKDNFLRAGDDWYDYQREVLPVILEKEHDCIVSIPTGGGKSVLFQGPAIYRAAFSRRLSLVITPLRALMQDQVEELHDRGFYTNVDYLSGDKPFAEVQLIYRRIASGELALLYVTPERFRVRSFMDVLLQRMEMDHGLEYVVYDEAHCISQWGQDFRPDYRNAVQKCVELKEKFSFIMAFFSATVTTQVENDLRSYMPDLIRVGQSPDDYNPVRSHIGINFGKCQHEDASRIDAIVQFILENNIDFKKSRMLVFCRTHKQCEETASALENIFESSSAEPLLLSCSGHVSYFHAGLDSEQRNDVYEQFKSDKEDRFFILCATKAFGMGMDIPNVHYVVHFNPPSVLEDYLQEVGRAGRNKEMYENAFPSGNQIPALCLTSSEDFAKLKSLLIKSLIKWSDLEEARSKAIEFIKRFQSIEETKKSPVVLPYNFWQKNDSTITVDDTTSAKLALHWLDYIGYIRQGYIDQAYLDITLLRDSLSHPSGYGVFLGSRSREDISLSKSASKLFDYIKDNVTGVKTPSLLSVVDMRNQLHFSLSRLFDAIIECQKKGLITLNDKMSCAVRPRRYLETRYMVEHSDNQYALHLIMEGIRGVLSSCNVGSTKTLHPNDVAEICKHLLDDVTYSVYTEKKLKKNGQVEEIVYMPWYKLTPVVPGAVTKAETFKKNIVTRAGLRMFSVMNYLPGIQCRGEKIEGELCYTISIKNGDWQSYLSELESDCFSWLKYISEKETTFTWSSAIIDLDWTSDEGKGYRYFDKILSILRVLSYIDYTPTIQSGIEIYTTDTSSNDWDQGEVSKSPYFKFREEFNQQEALKKIRLTAMNVFSEISSHLQGEYIKKYFLCRSYSEFMNLVGEYVPDGSAILQQLKEEALKREEDRLEGNDAQKAIYYADKGKNINVLAGPGSGKTHVLTLRCARLIYREAVDPTQILILAYNRAVVAELKTRLDSLFIKLGMSRIAHQLHVHTFLALARKVMGTLLDKYKTKEWETQFYKFLSHHRKDFKAMFPNLRYIMIDEFQDITQVRLDSLLEIHKIYPAAKFFTIGDINQSIYGFHRVPDRFDGTPDEYARILDPRPYYAQLKEELSPEEMQMFTNYRSYQCILDSASSFISDKRFMPISAHSLMEHEAEKPYVFITNNTQEKRKQWLNDLPDVIEKAKQENLSGDPHRKIKNIAIFFRTNGEVYRGFSKIKTRMSHEDIRIRIQGANNCELWREREIYEVIQYLEQDSVKSRTIILRNGESQREIRDYIKGLHAQYNQWDTELLDIVYTIVLNYLDSIRADEEDHAYWEIAEYIRDVAGNDDSGQVYKIFEQYHDQQLWPDNRLTIVLTTMHKVKGLEFDVVMITPSFADLPLKLKRRYGMYDSDTGERILPDITKKKPNAADVADIDEEKRLLFVAYTRAKKYLHVYKWQRELAIENRHLFITPNDNSLLYTEKEAGIDKYYLSFTASRYNFGADKYIREIVKKDDAVVLRRDRFNNLVICHNGREIGRLSSNSSILKVANENDVSSLEGFFISDIFIWTFSETKHYDEEHGTSYSDKWCPAAQDQGYITVVQIAGLGAPK